MASHIRNVTCPACAKNFTQTGFQSHLRQTMDPYCAALYAEIIGSTELSDQEAPKNIPDAHEPQPFEDVFSGHNDMDGDYFDQLHGPESGSMEDDDDSEIRADLESGWEPERPGARAASASLQTEGLQLADHDEPTTRSQADTRRILDSHVVVRYSDKYPDHKAGAPMKKTQSADVNYRTALDNSSNPWAPFSSHMDWEIAKWAKLRGAGSTAFSDLLAIEGVSNYRGSAFHTY
jgi:hypothetical protein